MSRTASLLSAVKRFQDSPLGGLLKLCVGVTILAFVMSTLDTATLRTVAARATPASVTLVASVSLLAHAIGALRFKLLCDPVVRLPYLAHLRQYFIGAYFSLFLPSSMGGDFVRLFLLRNAGATTAQSASLVLAERALGAVSLLVISSLGAAGGELPRELSLLIVLATAAACVAAVIGGTWATRLAPRHPGLAAAVEALRLVVTSPGRLRVLVASLAYQGATVLATVLVGLVLNLPVAPSIVFSLTPLVWFATLLPLSVGGLGIREAGFVVVFGWARVSAEHAVLLSLGTYASMVVVGLAGGAWFTWNRIRGIRVTPNPNRPEHSATLTASGEIPAVDKGGEPGR